MKFTFSDVMISNLIFLLINHLSYQEILVNSEFITKSASLSSSFIIEKWRPEKINLPGSTTNFTLICPLYFTENNNSQFQWYFNGILLLNYSNKKLQLNNLSKKNSGIYRCSLGTSFGKLLSLPIEINVLCKFCLFLF